MASTCYRGQVEEEVLARVKPSPLEEKELRQVAGKLVSRLEQELAQRGVKARVSVEGSFAKGTWLRVDPDLDIFVLLPRDVCLEFIGSGKILDILRRGLAGFRVEERYASHPYLHVVVDGLEADVVPACDTRWGEKPLTPVDRTPHHTHYIASRLGEVERDEVRLLKQFMKGVGVYGAEEAVRGFSGYLAELLIVKYRCFRTLLEEAAKRWRPRFFIPIEEEHERYRGLLRSRYPDSVLYVPDPVDPERNAAASVTLSSLARFIVAAQLYLAQPRLEFFFPPATKPDTQLLSSLVSSCKLVLVVGEAATRRPPDVLWGVGRRVARNLASLLSSHGFNVYGSSLYVEEEQGRIWIAVEVEEPVLPETEIVRGPPAWAREHVLRFVSRYSSERLWVDEDGRLVAIRRRRWRSACQLVEARLDSILPSSARNIQWRLAGGEELKTAPGGVLEWLEAFYERTPAWMRHHATQ